MASSLMMCTKEYVSDSVKSKGEKASLDSITQCHAQDQDSHKKVMTVGTYLMGSRCIVFYLCF